jgi:hypothetical protein
MAVIDVPRGTVLEPTRFGSFGSGCSSANQHGRRRRQVVRVDDVEQRLGKAREFGVELELDARRQKRNPFDQPLDVGVGDLEAVHAETRRDLRTLLGELGAHLTQVLQLDVVVLEEARIHYAPRVGSRSAICTFPVSRSISVRTSSSSGTGCAQSSLRISTPMTL